MTTQKKPYYKIVEIVDKEVNCHIYYDDKYERNHAYHTRAQGYSIVINIRKDEGNITTNIALQHEIGHVHQYITQPFNKPKYQDPVLWRERYAWKYASKRIKERKLLGRVMAGCWLSYLLNRNKLKNIEYWTNKLEYYEKFALKEAKPVLYRHRIKLQSQLKGGVK